MNNKLSRREALLGGSALAVTAIKLPQMTQSKEKATSDDVTKELAEPLKGEALANLPDAVRGVRGQSARRWRHRLVENSEPNLVFIALPKDARKW